MVEEEENNPTFEHPPNWNDLNSQEKADLIVINNMIKLICVADISSHYFKNVSLLKMLTKTHLSLKQRMISHS